MQDYTEQAKKDFKKRKETYGLKDFNNELDFQPIEVLKQTEPDERSRIVYSYKAKPTHRNVFGSLHGGIIASLCDGAMGQGAAILKRCSLNTVSLTITYLEPCVGDNYRIEVDYTHLGDRVVDALASLIDEDNGDRLCATGVGSFLVLNGRLPYLDSEQAERE